jgi:hypothetical protein
MILPHPSLTLTQTIKISNLYLTDAHLIGTIGCLRGYGMSMVGWIKNKSAVSDQTSNLRNLRTKGGALTESKTERYRQSIVHKMWTTEPSQRKSQSLGEEEDV